MSKVLLWRCFVGGSQDGQRAPGANLMSEGPVVVNGDTYCKRKLIICEQRIFVLAYSKMGTAEVSAALLRAALRSHPLATDEEPRSDPLDIPVEPDETEVIEPGGEVGASGGMELEPLTKFERFWTWLFGMD